MVKKPKRSLRAKVRTACWRELTLAFGTGRWRELLPKLKRHIMPPSPVETRARDLFAKLRSAILDVVIFTKVRHEGARRSSIDGIYEKDRGGQCARHLDALPPVLLPLLRSPRMALSEELLTLLTSAPLNVSKFKRVAQGAKKQPPTWTESRARSRLVSLLDSKNLLELPDRTTLPYGSRFLNSREYALVCLLLDVGVLDASHAEQRFETQCATAAAVIREEEKRMRITLKRHGWDAIQASEKRHRAPIRRGPD